MLLLCGFAVNFNFLPRLLAVKNRFPNPQIKTLSLQCADLRTDLQKCPAQVPEEKVNDEAVYLWQAFLRLRGYVLSKSAQFLLYSSNRPVGRAVTRTPLEREV